MSSEDRRRQREERQQRFEENRYENLPEGWPSDHRSLTHEQLDNFGIDRGSTKRPLSLESRQSQYRMKYLTSTEEQKHGNKMVALIAGGVVLVVAVVAVLWSVLSDGDDDDEPAVAGPDRYAAYDVCRQQVDLQLKAPATAEYPGVSLSSVAQSGNTFTITSHVDSENSYGALIRTEWTCTATWVSGSTYNVSAVVL